MAESESKGTIRVYISSDPGVVRFTTDKPLTKRLLRHNSAVHECKLVSDPTNGDTHLELKNGKHVTTDNGDLFRIAQRLYSIEGVEIVKIEGWHRLIVSTSVATNLQSVATTFGDALRNLNYEILDVDSHGRTDEEVAMSTARVVAKKALDEAAAEAAKKAAEEQIGQDADESTVTKAAQKAAVATLAENSDADDTPEPAAEANSEE